MDALLFLRVGLLFRRFGFDSFDELVEIGTHLRPLLPDDRQRAKAFFVRATVSSGMIRDAARRGELRGYSAVAEPSARSRLRCVSVPWQICPEVWRCDDGG